MAALKSINSRRLSAFLFFPNTVYETGSTPILSLHRSVPPSVLVELCKTQLYQRAQNDAPFLFSPNCVFRIKGIR
jgi:hypothetical protein